ncbi:MAG: biotin-independent malonate decarboxylase subunit gamma [Methylovirgula sp.]
MAYLRLRHWLQNAIFAPGLDNLTQTGAVVVVWDDKSSLIDRLDAILASEDDGIDKRLHHCPVRS